MQIIERIKNKIKFLKLAQILLFNNFSTRSYFLSIINTYTNILLFNFLILL